MFFLPSSSTQLPIHPNSRDDGYRDRGQRRCSHTNTRRGKNSPAASAAAVTHNGKCLCFHLGCDSQLFPSSHFLCPAIRGSVCVSPFHPIALSPINQPLFFAPFVLFDWMYAQQPFFAPHLLIIIQGRKAVTSFHSLPRHLLHCMSVCGLGVRRLFCSVQLCS